jgi:hypothetical protein
VEALGRALRLDRVELAHLAWNDAASAPFRDFGQLAPEERNTLHWMLDLNYRHL